MGIRNEKKDWEGGEGAHLKALIGQLACLQIADPQSERPIQAHLELGILSATVEKYLPLVVPQNPHLPPPTHCTALVQCVQDLGGHFRTSCWACINQHLKHSTLWHGSCPTASVALPRLRTLQHIILDRVTCEVQAGERASTVRHVPGAKGIHWGRVDVWTGGVSSSVNRSQ